MGARERRGGMFDLSPELVAAMEADGWELVAVVRHIGRQHPGETEFVFERAVGAEGFLRPPSADRIRRRRITRRTAAYESDDESKGDD